MFASPFHRAAAAIGVAALVWTSSADARGFAGDAKVLCALLRQNAKADDAGRATALAQLADLGPEAVPAVLDVLARGRLCGGGPKAAELDASGEAFLMEGLRAWPEDQVRGAVERYLGEAPDLGARMLAVGVLGEVGGVSSLPALLEIAGGLSAREARSAHVSRSVASALTGILVRDPEAHRSLGRRLPAVEPHLFSAVVAAVARAGRDEGIPVLRDLLTHPEVDEGAVLEALSQLDVRTAARAAAQCQDVVRPFLRSPDPDSRREAALALGRLRDGRAFADLFKLLGDPDHRVRKAALWALQNTSGLGWPAQAARWDAWYRAEQAWLSDESGEWMQATTDEDPGRALRAVRELAAHPLFRRRLTETLSTCMGHADENVAVAACAALARLGDPSALGPLVQTLGDSRVSVRRAALASLQELTGADLPPHTKAWRVWMQG